jgi:hypothetical protein
LVAFGNKPNAGKKKWQLLPSQNVGMPKIWQQPTNQALYR